MPEAVRTSLDHRLFWGEQIRVTDRTWSLHTDIFDLVPGNYEPWEGFFFAWNSGEPLQVRPDTPELDGSTIRVDMRQL